MENYSTLELIISIAITWSIGLIPPTLIRFVFLARPMTKNTAIITSAIFWLVNIAIFTALGSQNKTHTVLLLIAYVSYRILLKEGKSSPSKPATSPAPAQIKQHICADCNKTFKESELKNDALFCPSCGGRAE